MDDKGRVTAEVSAKYIETSRRALAKVSIAAPERSYNHVLATDFLSMASAYFSDAEHFHSEGDYARALACVNYAHGWLDAGARLGLFDVQGDDQLFTLYE